MFCDISTRNELADYLGIPHSKLTYILYVAKVDSYYKTFEIPKKSGGMRCIKAPTGDLKEIQGKLADALWEHQKEIQKVNNVRANISHAFEKDKSIITNAKVHRNKRVVVNVDLENFFDAFHFGRVRGFFEKNKFFDFPIEVATVIAQLVCFQGSLPQGAPSSPIITNLICQIFDMRLVKLAKKYKLDYTRYADDITFSTNRRAFAEDWDGFYSDLQKEILNAGFKINEKKTRIQFRDSRQTVTGLVVNKKLSIDRRYYKMVRAMANKLYTDGVFTIDGKEGRIEQLEGRFAFIDQIEKYNNGLNENTKHNYRLLNGREKQYQQFLFYRYFFANDKPVIVTEGKTDIAYLKSALKNLYKDYPELIEKHDNGTFEFKVSFLRKTKKLAYFLGISQDGADAMKVLYNYFSDKEKANCSNYLRKIMKISGRAPSKPVIMVFDNELQNGKKPLAGFMKYINASESQCAELRTQLCLRLIPDGNLFLLTNPLVDNQTECEIEQLFDEQTRAHVFEGKTLSLSDNFDNTKHYSKEIFSRFIQENYRGINFSRFKPLLNNINNIVSSYGSN